MCPKVSSIYHARTVPNGHLVGYLDSISLSPTLAPDSRKVHHMLAKILTLKKGIAIEKTLALSPGPSPSLSSSNPDHSKGHLMLFASPAREAILDIK